MKAVEKDSIIETYEVTGSIRRTAQELNISHSTVRRVILEAGLYTSERAQEIQKLWESGLSVDQIAEKMHVCRNTVWAYLPYERGYQLSSHKSVNALRIQACRERKKAKLHIGID